jgi:hypothetical protein
MVLIFDFHIIVTKNSLNLDHLNKVRVVRTGSVTIVIVLVFYLLPFQVANEKLDSLSDLSLEKLHRKKF